MRLQDQLSAASKYEKESEKLMTALTEKAKANYVKPSFFERIMRKYRTWMYDFKRREK